jgi:hypothetical protein
VPPDHPANVIPGIMQRIVRSKRSQSVAALAVCWLAAAFVFVLGPAQIGFMSDDHDLIATAAATPWLGRLEPHHYSPALAVLFKLTSQGAIGPVVWRGLAFLGHCVNILLLWRILVGRLAINRVAAWAATFWFSMNAPGFEALAWACALGYVGLTALILLAVELSLRQPEEFSWPAAVALAFLQLAAYAVWDWAVLMAPVVALSYLASPRPLAGEGQWVRASASEDTGLLRTAPPWLRAAAFFAPMIACWAAVPIVKWCAGITLGYHVSIDVVRAGYFLLTAPLRGIYPQGTASLYKSPAGLAAATVAIVLLAASSRSDRRIRWAALLFVLCQVPYALFGAPESRYFYLGIAFLASAVALAVGRIRHKRLRLAALVTLAAINALWAVDRSILWKGAYREAVRVKEAVEAIAAREAEKPLVIVNLPDRYGPADLVWRPYVWRNGLAAIRAPIARVNTPDCPFNWIDSDIPAMAAGQIASKYAGQPICEVIYADPADWRVFAVVPWAVRP